MHTCNLPPEVSGRGRDSSVIDNSQACSLPSGCEPSNEEEAGPASDLVTTEERWTQLLMIIHRVDRPSV